MASNAPFAYPPPAVPGPNSPMYRGYIYTSQPGPSVGSPSDIIHFQFNPNSIRVAYSGDIGAIPGDPQSSPTSSAGSPAVGLTTVQFDLVFDRTVEVATGGAPNGVFDDVHTIETVYGIFQDQAIEGGVSPGAQTGSPATKMSTFVFSTKISKFQYRGIVTSVGIEYIYFTPQMVPLRCNVAFVMSQVQGQGQANFAGGQFPPSAPATAVPAPTR